MASYNILLFWCPLQVASIYNPLLCLRHLLFQGVSTLHVTLSSNIEEATLVELIALCIPLLWRRLRCEHFANIVYKISKQPKLCLKHLVNILQ